MTDPRTIALCLSVALLAAGGAGLFGYASGHAAGIEDEKGDRARADLAVMAERAASSSAAQSEIDSLTRGGAEQAIRRDEAFRTIREHTREIIERPVYRNICVDADGVQQLDRAVAAANGQPEGIAVSAGDPAGVSDGAPAR